MAALKNAKHERFCQAYVRGATAGNGTASYKSIYGKADRTAASRLLHNAGICQRIAELQDQVTKIEVAAVEMAAERLGITKTKVLGELAKIGFANMLDYIRTTDDGDVYVDLSRLDRDTASAIQEVVVDSYVEGGGESARQVKRVRFKLGDKRGALVDLGKHLGLFVDRHVVETPDLKSVQFVDKPAAETYEQWQERRSRELAGKRGVGPSKRSAV